MLQASGGFCQLAEQQPIALGVVMNDERLVQYEHMAAASSAVTANLSRAELLAEMSHEIRTPLNALLGMLKLVLKTDLTPEQAEYLGLMNDAGDSLLSLVNSILDFSRIKAGKLEIETIPFSLRACLGDILKMLALEARQKGLALSCEIDRDVPDALLGDPLRLRQILVNLVANAIKFSDRGTIVTRVSLQAGNTDEMSCHFSVSDQGIGISPEQQATIFRPYRQVDRSIARRYGGSGLGLSIAAQLVEIMNGRLWVDSAPGLGSTFHFTACFGRQEACASCSQAGCMAQLGLPETPSPTLSVLLVDDNPTNRRFAQITLEQAGHRVILADSGAAVKALLATESPDLILMDIQMPDMDGLQLTTAIRNRELRSGKHMPIIALTARALPQDRESCLRAGMDDYLVKPIDPDVLLAAIQHLGHRAAKPHMNPRSCTVLDRGALLLQVNGDLNLLCEIRSLFLRDCGQLMMELRQSINHHDAETFSLVLHTLQGMFSSLSANAAQEAARNLERLGIRHQRLGVSHARLEHELKTLKAALLAMVRDGKSILPANRPASAKALRESRPPVPGSRGKPPRTWKGLPRASSRGAGRHYKQTVLKGDAQ